MGLSQVIAPLIIGAIGTVVATLVAAYVARAKTSAEVENLRAASSVTVSADNREWATLFVSRADAAEKRADAAERRADQAEHRADEAEHRADQAERRADQAETRVDELESKVIKGWGYVRAMREVLRANGLTPPPLPADLEEFWSERNERGAGE
jgi:hypothetical protein